MPMLMKRNFMLQTVVFLIVYVGISILLEGFSVAQIVKGLLATVIYGLLMYGISRKKDQ